MRPGARRLIGHSAPIGVPGIWWTVCASVVAGQGWLCLGGIDEPRLPERIVPQQQRDAVTVWKVPEGKEPVAKHQDQHDRGRPPTERCASWRPCRWN